MNTSPLSFLQGSLEDRCAALTAHLHSLVEPRKNARSPGDSGAGRRRPGPEVALIQRALVHARRVGVAGPEAVEYLALLTLPLRVRFNARLSWKDLDWPQIPLAQIPTGSRAYRLLRQALMDRDAAWLDQAGPLSPVRVQRDDPAFSDGVLWRQHFGSPPVVAYPLMWPERCSILAPSRIPLDAFCPACLYRSVTTCWSLDILPPLPRDPTPEEKPAHDALEAALDALPHDPGYEAARQRGGVEDPLRIDLGGGMGARIQLEVRWPRRDAHGAALETQVVTRFFLSDSSKPHHRAVEEAGYGRNSEAEIGASMNPADILQLRDPEHRAGSAPFWRFAGPAGGSTVPNSWSVIPSSCTPEEANLLVFLGVARTAWNEREAASAGAPSWKHPFKELYSERELKDFLSLLEIVLLRQVEQLASARGWPRKHLTAVRRQITPEKQWLQALALDLLNFEFPGKPESLLDYVRWWALREWDPMED